MKLQIKFLLLLLFAFMAIGGLLAVQRNFDLQRSNQVLASELDQRKSRFASSLTSEGRTFQKFSEDYSFWDEMVTFVKTNNLQFARVNLDSGLSTFGADAYWVYKPDGTLLHSNRAGETPTIAPLNLPTNFFNQLTGNKFEHFYLHLPQGTLEIRAATIVPGDDAEHLTTPAGFWLVGRFLGDTFKQDIDSLSQSTVTFRPPTEPTKDIIGSNSVTFSTQLKDWQGSTVRLLNSSSRVSVINDLNVIYRREILLLLMISAAMLSLVSLAIWWLVLRPVHRITTSIQNQQPKLLDNLSRSQSQFGDLARIIQQFFAQKLIIQEDQFKKEELERLNKEKTAFLAVAAHELKGPIAIVKMLSEDLPKSNNEDETGKPFYKNLAIITHQVKKMSTLISDLRLASEGKEDSTYNPTVFDFDNFIREEITEMGFIINQELQFEGSTGMHVRADTERLSQVISNLIRNASKYSPSADKIIIRSSVKDKDIVMQIEDFGIGISAEDQAHLFERYFRSPQVQEAYQGLGLGLSISKNIIDRMGGKMWVESELGHGTSFFFSIPVAASQDYNHHENHEDNHTDDTDGNNHSNAPEDQDATHKIGNDL